MSLSYLKRAASFADEQFERLKRERDEAMAQWEPRLKEASLKAADAQKRVARAEASIQKSLSDWIVHDGGAQPVSNDTMILYRVKHEWVIMQDGGVPSLSEPTGGCEADFVKWEWTDSEWDDVAAYRIVPASGDTLPKGQDAKQGLAGTEGNAVAKPDAESPSS